MRSPIYWHPLLYESSIRLIYGRNYKERFCAVADFIDEGESVVDLCAGDCAVFRYALRDKHVDYIACDINETFLTWAERREISTKRLDVIDDALPEADCVIMMGSLCQFIPNEKNVIQKMINAARRRVILTEPVRNWSQSPWTIVRWLGRFGSSLETGEAPHRFTQETLTPVLKSSGFQPIHLICGQRELIAVFDKTLSLTSG